VTNEELETATPVQPTRPYRPFLLEFLSGEQVHMHHREAIAFFSPLWLYRGPNQAQAVFPSSAVCRLLDITPDA